MDKVENVLTVIGMGGTFFVTLAVFVWWCSRQFFGLKLSINKEFADFKDFIKDKHSENVLRFTKLESRVEQLERKRSHGV